MEKRNKTIENDKSPKTRHYFREGNECYLNLCKVALTYAM